MRYSRLSNEQMRVTLLNVCKAEGVNFTDDGLDAIIFTAEGDMRHALNNLQASHSLAKGLAGDALVNEKLVFQVCDQPHPNVVREMINCCHKGELKEANVQLQKLWSLGYAPSDIIGTLFKVTKGSLEIPEGKKLEYLREIGFTHMRISNGVNSLLQLLGLMARLCQTEGK